MKDPAGRRMSLPGRASGARELADPPGLGPGHTEFDSRASDVWAGGSPPLPSAPCLGDPTGRGTRLKPAVCGFDSHPRYLLVYLIGWTTLRTLPAYGQIPHLAQHGGRRRRPPSAHGRPDAGRDADAGADHPRTLRRGRPRPGRCTAGGTTSSRRPFPGSSNGRMPRSERGDRGSSPCPGAIPCPRSPTAGGNGLRCRTVRVRVAPRHHAGGYGYRPAPAPTPAWHDTARHGTTGACAATAGSFGLSTGVQRRLASLASPVRLRVGPHLPG